MKRIQKEVARRAREEDPGDVERVAGVDVAYRGDSYRAAAVVTDLRCEELDRAVTEGETSFPYVPGYLAFREGPPALEALEALEEGYDLLLVNGHGKAHPRRAGLATHLGVVLDVPTVGVASRPLVGEPDGPPPEEPGDWTPLVHEGDVVGALVLTRPGTRPLVVSPGHRCDLRSAVDIVLRTSWTGCGSTKWPEPLRLADALSKGREV